MSIHQKKQRQAKSQIHTSNWNFNTLQLATHISTTQKIKRRSEQVINHSTHMPFLRAHGTSYQERPHPGKIKQIFKNFTIIKTEVCILYLNEIKPEINGQQENLQIVKNQNDILNNQSMGQRSLKGNKEKYIKLKDNIPY